MRTSSFIEREVHVKIEHQADYRAALLRLRDRVQQAGDEHARRATIAEIDEALKRLEHGTFGVCERCFTVMPKVELTTRPYSRVCCECERRKAA